MTSRTLHLLIVAVTLASFVFVTPAHAQTSDFPVSAWYTFGEKITFNGVLPLGSRVDSATLYFLAEGELKTRSGVATVDRAGQVRYVANLADDPIRAFSTVAYWFEVTLKNGQAVKSERGSLYYEDNRFEWRKRASADFRVHWYEGDDEFAQSLLDVAELGLENIQKYLPPLKLSKPVELYAYASAQEMRVSLQTLGNNWVGAHADPQLGVMLVSLPRGPEQRLEMERQIPHELMHLLLYQWLGVGYGNLPAWLNEGLASIAELYPNPDYLTLLDKANEQDKLLPMASLCQTFPRDASGAFLAYAQATSFTRYLHQQFGSTGLEKLARAYADGLSCERGVQTALGSSLSQLEHSWRGEAFREDALLKVLANLAPWLVVLLALFVSLGFVLLSSKRKSTPQVSSSSR